MPPATFDYEKLEWIDDVPRITTSRMILRLSEEEDADDIVEFYERNHEHFKPWFPDMALSPTLEMVLRGAREKRELAQADRGYRFHAFLRSLARNEVRPQVVGLCSMADVRRGAIQQGVIGYAIDREFEGQGLMKEIVRAVIKFAFHDLDLHRIEGSYMPENVKSAAILEALGFVKEGFFKDYLYLNNRWQDHIVTSLINPDWKGTGRVIQTD